MIKKFNIENYKGFDNLNLQNLSRINLFGGKNNVGKTSLLESIFTFYDRYNTDLFIKQSLLRGGIFSTVKDETQHELWLSAFNNYDIKKNIKLTSIDEKNNIEDVKFNIDEDFIIPLNTNDLQNLHKELNINSNQTKSKYALHIEAFVNNENKQDSYTYLLNNNIQMFVKFLEAKNRKIVTFLSTKTINPINESVKFGELITKGFENRVVDILKIIEPRIKSIYPIPISENQTILHADIGLSRKIPLNYLGDGIFRLLSYISSILNTPNGIVLIDEIENGFHFSIHKKIWDIIFEISEENNVQLFINTHSLEMVNAFNTSALNTNPDKFMYYELFQKVANNSISVNNIDTELLKFKLKNRKSFRGE